MEDSQKDRPSINKFVHPPVVTLIFVGIAHLLGWYIRVPFGVPSILQTIGFWSTVGGFLLAVGALIEFKKAGTTLDPHGSATSLVTGGVYRFSRNPIYLGFLLMVVGLPLNSGFYSGIVLAPFFALTMNRLVIEKEEAYLEKKFGEEYTGYRSGVRRWV
jgi:protein-S-isoprenylcysteine O-methyltransferase Ste14